MCNIANDNGMRVRERGVERGETDRQSDSIIHTLLSFFIAQLAHLRPPEFKDVKAPSIVVPFRLSTFGNTWDSVHFRT